MSQSELADIGQRLAAKYTFGRNILVEAGAGTGKTRLLVERLAFWILGVRHSWLDREKESPAEFMVALTFTEKAAAEMKVRLASRLRQAACKFADGAWREDVFLADPAGRSALSVSEMARAAQLAAQRLDRAQIGTIHSFASHILRLYPVEAGLDPSSEVDAGAAFDLLFEDEWRKWLETELSGAGGRTAQWKKALRSLDISELRGVALSLCQSRMANFNPRGGFAGHAGLCRLKAARARELAAKNLDGKKPRKIEQSLSRAALALDALAQALETGDFRRAEPAPDAPAAAAPAGWTEEEFAAAAALVEFARTATVEGQAAVLDAVELLSPFARQMRAAFAEKALLSFDDLLVRARDLARDNILVRNALKSRYHALLIDEFQDTDPLQGELLLYLAEEAASAASGWQKLRLEPGKLFIVGDPKQSIYRFRGADIMAYSHFESLLESQGALRCVLSVNFRSGREIIGAVNHILPKVLRGEPGLQPNYTPIAPSPAAESAPAQLRAEAVLISPPKDEKRVSADEWRENQAAFIADWIEENRGKLEAEPGRKLEHKDVAVLLRATTALDIYLEAFKRRGIPYAVEEDRFFYSTQETADLLNLLRAAGDPSDKMALCGLLRSPLGGLTDRELCELSRRGGLDSLRAAPPEFAGLEEFYAMLRGLNSQAGRVPPDALLEMALEGAFAPELLGRAYHGEQTVSNIRKFARIAARHALEEGLGLEGFIRRAGDFIGDRAREGESPLADEFMDAVRIMTVHKAKGLEFPVVIIPDISGRRGGGGKKPELRCDWVKGTAGLRAGRYADCAMAALEECERRHESFEEVRNFYVALTRARGRLMLVGNLAAPGAETYAGYLAAAGIIPSEPDAQEGFKSSPLMPLRLVEWRESGSPKRAARAAAAATPLANPAAWHAAWKERTAARALVAGAERFTSPTAIERGEEAGQIAQELEEFSAGPDRLLLGKLCHRVLEMHGFGGRITEEEVKAALNYFAFQHHVPDYEAAAREAHEILSAFAESGIYREIAAAEIIGREYPFTCRLETGRASAMRGVMDIVLRRAGRLVIMDYKTEYAAAGREALAAEKYRVQAQAYREAAARLFGEPAELELIFLRSLTRARL